MLKVKEVDYIQGSHFGPRANYREGNREGKTIDTQREAGMSETVSIKSERQRVRKRSGGSGAGTQNQRKWSLGVVTGS